jgi:hypothetical protein
VCNEYLRQITRDAIAATTATAADVVDDENRTSTKQPIILDLSAVDADSTKDSYINAFFTHVFTIRHTPDRNIRAAFQTIFCASYPMDLVRAWINISEQTFRRYRTMYAMDPTMVGFTAKVPTHLAARASVLQSNIDLIEYFKSTAATTAFNTHIVRLSDGTRVRLPSYTCNYSPELACSTFVAKNLKYTIKDENTGNVVTVTPKSRVVFLQFFRLFFGYAIGTAGSKTFLYSP